MEHLLDAEEELWAAVTSGDSLSQHFEDAYLISLRQCVRQRQQQGKGAPVSSADPEADEKA